MTDFTRALNGWKNRTFLRADMALRAAFWADGATKGQILLLGGMRDFAEKNTPEAMTFAEWGYSTVYLDWHHQGRSGRLPAIPPTHSYVADFAEYDADLAALLPHISPTLVIAHSMGAHNVLRYWAQHGLTIPLVLTAPLMGARVGLPEPVARIAAQLAVLVGLGPRLAPGQRPYARPPFEGNIYSRDPARFAEMFDWMEHDPALMKAGATYGWVAAFLRSVAWLRQPEVLSRIKAPVLAFLTPNDPLVVGPAQEVLAQHIPNIMIERLPHATHEPLRDEAATRDFVMGKIRTFLENKAALSRKG